MMAALEVVNLRVSYQVDVRSRESSEFYSRHHDAQKDRAAVRAENLKVELTAGHLEVRVTVVRGLRRVANKWQVGRGLSCDEAFHAYSGLEVGAAMDTLEYTGSVVPRMFLEEVDKIEKYIGGLPDMITRSDRNRKERKYDDLSKNNQNQQQQNKRQNTGQAYTAGNSDKKPYVGLNLCVPSVITIMKVLVHLGAITAKRLAIWPRIVEADLQITTTATTTTIIRREMVAMSAELKVT
ncbi:hypothetical protein Tco_0759592 [Tanacetum coccineum]